jgi:hypothetical protein
MSRTSKLTSVGMAALVAAAIVIVVALGARESNAQAPLSIAPQFKVLRAPAIGMSTDVKAGLESISSRVKLTTGSPLKPVLWQARKASSGQSLYIAANDDTVCLVGLTPERYFNCTTIEAAADADTPMISAGSDGQGGGVQALFPDGISEVSVETTDGRTTRLSLINNVVSQNVAGVPGTLRWRSADGAQHNQKLDNPEDKG